MAIAVSDPSPATAASRAPGAAPGLSRIAADLWRCRLGWICYGALFLTAVAVVVANTPPSGPDAAVLWPLGILATWRYGWQLTHFLRAEFYRSVRFPAWRRAADVIAADPAQKAAHIGVVATSYQISARENFEVYSALFAELAAYGAPATVIAAVTDDGDARLAHQIHRDCQTPDHIRLVTQLQAGTGKRDAMAKALRTLKALTDGHCGVVVLMDGDTVVTPGLFRRSCPFFRLMPDLAALTVNNRALTRGGETARAWYGMRFALRNLYMSSLSLSRRVLCLTGRFSLFRGAVALDDAFIDRLQRDEVGHWRLGTIRMLTGDDKSTWFHCLKGGWAMIYTPDAEVVCLEELPGGGFLNASARLMQRWFGNMLRNSDRSIALGPRRMGVFTWWCLVDQRLSMWTSLSGPVFAAYFIARGDAVVGPAYLAMVLLSRFVQTVNVSWQGGAARPIVPFLLLHQQFVGSLIKIHTLFHLDRQRWTRQRIGGGGSRTAAAYGDALKALTGVIFIALIVLLAAVTTQEGR